VETRRARDREVLPRQHPITSKGNLLSSSSEETIRRWVGATFSGWDVGGHFATRKSGSVAQYPTLKDLDRLSLMIGLRATKRVGSTGLVTGINVPFNRAGRELYAQTKALSRCRQTINHSSDLRKFPVKG